ncbi:MAG: DUF6498-containing protein [Desulfomonilia bacterium]
MPRDSFSITVLVTANLVPLSGVVLFGWDAAVIVLLYWSENIIIGFYNILKMVFLMDDGRILIPGKVFMVPFFCVHFGGFCAAHGFFLMTFFNLGSPEHALSFPHTWPGPLVFVQMLVSVIIHLWQNRPPGMEWPLLCLVLSHGMSFVQNYLGRQEYTSFSLNTLMGLPYKRIVLMHVAIIAGGLPVMVLGSPVPLLIVLVFLKIGLDIWLHQRSHDHAHKGKRGIRRDRQDVQIHT